MLKLNRAAPWMLFLAAGVAFQHSAWAQPDSPIIIHGGSPLTLQYDSGWQRTDDFTVITRYRDTAVTRVTVTLDGGTPQEIVFGHKPCEIRLRYGPINVAVQTDANGQKLLVAISGGARFDKELVKKSEGLYQSLLENERVESLTILKGGVPQPVGKISGPVDIRIEHERANHKS